MNEELKEFKKPIIETIKKRASCRTFNPKSLEENLYDQVTKYLNQEFFGFIGKNKARFKLLEIDLNNRLEKKKYGTYGFIKNAPYFIIGAISNNKHHLLDFGYIFERIILYFTELDFGTCWLGGTFKRTNFSEYIDLKESESLPAISPLGYPEKRRFVENIMRWSVKADSRKPWNEIFFKNNFNTPLTENDLNENKNFIEILNCVRLAPSARNKQPWRLLYMSDQNIFHFFAQIENPNSDSFIKNYQQLDLGISICHFDLVAKFFNTKLDWFFSNQDELEITKPNNKFYIISCKIQN